MHTHAHTHTLWKADHCPNSTQWGLADSLLLRPIYQADGVDRTKEPTLEDISFHSVWSLVRRKIRVPRGAMVLPRMPKIPNQKQSSPLAGGRKCSRSQHTAPSLLHIPFRGQCAARDFVCLTLRMLQFGDHSVDNSLKHRILGTLEAMGLRFACGWSVWEPVACVTDNLGERSD